MGKYFGTDGVRGVAGEDLSCELAMKIGRGAAAVLTDNAGGRKPRILIGKDTRMSGDMLEAALTADPFYIGALGSYRTHQRRVDKLQELGWDERDIARIKAPIGSFPQARDANTLALSVVADVAAVRAHTR